MMKKKKMKKKKNKMMKKKKMKAFVQELMVNPLRNTGNFLRLEEYRF
jgi:hypothetical protein